MTAFNIAIGSTVAIGFRRPYPDINGVSVKILCGKWAGVSAAGFLALTELDSVKDARDKEVATEAALKGESVLLNPAWVQIVTSSVKDKIR